MVKKLRNDCFALPAGVHWTPVDEALDRLEHAIETVVEAGLVDLSQASRRRLAKAPLALRAHPPAANTAVDGYGFAHTSLSGEGPHALALIEGRSAAGAPFSGAVRPGAAIRILTGAILPEGVDTVVLQEDVEVDGKTLHFSGRIKPGANCRAAGEDMVQDQPLLRSGHVLRAPDLGMLAAAGVASVDVFDHLRVGVLSTGDELMQPGQTAHAGQVYDANRPVLLDMIDGWSHQAVDLGAVGDDRDAVRARLNEAAERTDAILTSGGASAGDEDHVSALLRSEGSLSNWRIALKPGRPLVLGFWKDTPVFGLPGNPVAAFVCAALFARPALSKMAGGDWLIPDAVMVPAAFSKSKKPGRREYLRARLTDDGRAEVFASEGSGRVSGLSWATGLVELGDEAVDIAPGTPVRYLPYSGLLN